MLVFYKLYIHHIPIGHLFVGDRCPKNTSKAQTVSSHSATFQDVELKKFAGGIQDGTSGVQDPLILAPSNLRCFTSARYFYIFLYISSDISIHSDGVVVLDMDTFFLVDIFLQKTLLAFEVQ